MPNRFQRDQAHDHALIGACIAAVPLAALILFLWIVPVLAMYFGTGIIRLPPPYRGVTAGISAAQQDARTWTIGAGGALGCECLAIDQKSQVTSCYFHNCRTGLSEAVRASFPEMKKFANAIGNMGRNLTAALWAHGPASPASAA